MTSRKFKRTANSKKPYKVYDPSLLHPKERSCESCRSRKVRCSMGRPACVACVRRAVAKKLDPNTVICQYRNPEDGGAQPSQTNQALAAPSSDVSWVIGSGSKVEGAGPAGEDQDFDISSPSTVFSPLLSPPCAHASSPATSTDDIDSTFTPPDTPVERPIPDFQSPHPRQYNDSDWDSTDAEGEDEERLEDETPVVPTPTRVPLIVTLTVPSRPCAPSPHDTQLCSGDTPTRFAPYRVPPRHVAWPTLRPQQQLYAPRDPDNVRPPPFPTAPPPYAPATVQDTVQHCTVPMAPPAPLVPSHFATLFSSSFTFAPTQMWHPPTTSPHAPPAPPPLPPPPPSPQARPAIPNQVGEVACPRTALSNSLPATASATGVRPFRPSASLTGVQSTLVPALTDAATISDSRVAGAGVCPSRLPVGGVSHPQQAHHREGGHHQRSRSEPLCTGGGYRFGWEEDAEGCGLSVSCEFWKGGPLSRDELLDWTGWRSLSVPPVELGFS